MVLKKMFFICIVISQIFIHSSQQHFIHKNRATPSTLMLKAIDWLDVQKQLESDQRTHPIEYERVFYPGTLIELGTLTVFSKERIPLVQLRYGPYCYITFTENASPEKLANTPLEPLLMYLESQLPPNSTESVRINLSKDTFMDCQRADESIHCVKRCI